MTSEISDSREAADDKQLALHSAVHAADSWKEYYSPAYLTAADRDIDISFFVACYNEEANIVRSLNAMTAAAQEVGCSWEAIVIDDASKDRSAEVVQEYLKTHPEYPIRLRVRAMNQGLAQNYIDAAFLGRGQYYKLVCGDDAESKEAMVTVLRQMGKADIVIPCHEVVGRSLFRRIVSRTYTLIVNAISGHRIMYYNGVGIHRRYNVMRWHTNYHGFSFQADLITRLLDRGATYVEIKTVSQERKTGGASTALTWKNFLSVAHLFMDLMIRRVGRSARKPGACCGS